MYVHVFGHKFVPNLLTLINLGKSISHIKKEIGSNPFWLDCPKNQRLIHARARIFPPIFRAFPLSQFMSFIFNQPKQKPKRSATVVVHRKSTPSHHSHTVRVKHSVDEQALNEAASRTMQRRSSLVKDSSIGNSPAALSLHVGGVEPLRKFSISACRRPSSFDLPENQFVMTIMISNSETNEQIWYKQDGARFGASQLTLKFGTNSLYKIHLKTRPPQKFESLHIGGSELKLEPIENGISGEYSAVWNTADKMPTKKGTRQDIEFVLAGIDKTLSKKFQVKFYPRADSHAGWGQKLDQITWQCTFNELGNVSVTEEQTI